MICVRTKGRNGVQQFYVDDKHQDEFVMDIGERVLEYAENYLENSETVHGSRLYKEIEKAKEENDAKRMYEILSYAQVFCCYNKKDDQLFKIKVVGKDDNVYYNRTEINPYETMAIKSIGLHMSGVFSKKGDEYFEDVLD